MKSIFLDFDNTIVESNKRIIEIMNKKYNLNKTEADLKDFGYKSIHPISQEEILDMYDSEEFFKELELKPGVLDIINKYKNQYKIIITTKGTKKNLEIKKEWIKNNLFDGIEFIGIENDNFSKKMIEMKDSIQIDDNMAALDTNAAFKILYKSYNNFSWQRINPCDNIVIANTWREIDDILNFYANYDYKTLERND